MTSSFASQFNLRSPAVKRLMKEAAELAEPTEDYYAQPLEHNLFEWHFTVRGPSDTDFAGGLYHGRIILPTEYPMKPPSIILLTPNGRFEVSKKICLSISGHHPESWQPSWSIRTALLAIIGFMPTESRGAIGGLDYTPEERRELATKSQTWSCSACGPIKSLLKDRSETPCEPSSDNQEAKELAKQIRFKEIDSGNTNQRTIKDSEQTMDKKNDENLTMNSDSTNIETRRRRIGVVHHDHSATEGSQKIPQVTPSISLNSPSYEASVQSSRTRLSSYIIVILILAIAFLLFRRIFLTDSE
ncbi:ubiquitin-conjugating enzyme E2 J1 [Tetranychus urticae]|uniref:UBC core domain-containing protein n=1 Tax=Tetranychus urticae TaxID=32264 RepID=T1KAW7_TETUR|nr:ubiquitin-conjugating enzyme E2 J1 [Tetranychus urticae]